MIRLVTATRYVTPLREGGSLPAVVEADDDGIYVIKFVGASQGPKALIAELIVGEIGRALGLPVPEIVFIELPASLGAAEPEPAIRDLLVASTGLNLGLRYLPGAFAYDVLLRSAVDAALASRVVWFDAFALNIDRTAKNTNLLIWQSGLWLIDHGAALYVHHDWRDFVGRSKTAFPEIRGHALLHVAGGLERADAELRPHLGPNLIRAVVDAIPSRWLGDEPAFADHDAHRAAYAEMLSRRLEAAPAFLEEAKRARTERV